MKNRKIIAVILVSVLMLCGCAETENGTTTHQKIVEEVDISAIHYPEQVTIYETKFWEPDAQTMMDVFLQGEPTFEEKSNDARRYERESDMVRYLSLYNDGEGMVYSLDYPNQEMEEGTLPSRYDTDLASMEFSVTKDIAGEQAEGSPVYREAVDLVRDYMERLGMPDVLAAVHRSDPGLHDLYPGGYTVGGNQGVQSRVEQ